MTTRFLILLGGVLELTPRLLGQIAGARVIAADSGMKHASLLGLAPELWVGDFDSAGSELAIDYADVPRAVFPVEKDATDGEIAVDEALKRGAREIILVGGFGGQMDHALGHMGLALSLARRGISCLVTSGTEEAWPLINQVSLADLAPGTRLSVLPFSDLANLNIIGVKWPLTNRQVALGQTLTLSNVAIGPVSISVSAGHGLVLTYPQGTL